MLGATLRNVVLSCCMCAPDPIRLESAAGVDGADVLAEGETGAGFFCALLAAGSAVGGGADATGCVAAVFSLARTACATTCRNWSRLTGLVR